MRLDRVLLLAAALLLPAGVASADVKPHPLFTDNMVLQHGEKVAVWGISDPNEGVGVVLEFRSDSGVAISSTNVSADKDGNWNAAINMKGMKPGTGYTLKIKGANEIVFKNVAVGEVFICSGQSNMEWSVNAGEDPARVKAEAKHPNIRLFTVAKRTAAHPITDQGDLGHFSKWSECSPDTVAGFSAVAYHFGVKLQKELDVPVGLIHTSWGGTPAQAWASLEAMEAEPSLKYYAEAGRAAAKANDSYDPKVAMANYEKALEAWKLAAEKAKADNKPVPKAPGKPGAKPQDLGPGTPGVLYNAMIHPLLNFQIKGAIWYQGESNAGKAYEYRMLFPTMIADWRAKFKNELPFFLVQLAPFWDGDSNGVRYAELRDSQLYTTKKLPKVGIAVITDVGDEKDIHPKPKQPVGERLAISALGIAYGKKNVVGGPLYKDMTADGNKAVLTFDQVGGGLVAKGDELAGFTVAGSDNVFHPAKAEIKGETVVVSSEKVEKVVSVRYGWVNFAKPTLNFFNKDGLPASPFKTDDLPYTTAPKK